MEKMKTKTLSFFLILTLGFSAAVFAASGDLKGDSTTSPQAGTSPQVKSYDQLLAAIRATRNASQARIEAIVEQEKVREAWETGRLIDEHVLQHQERADYGTQVIVRLAGDLVMSERELYYMLEFYRAYPILPLTAELSWSHYRDLLSVNDRKERNALAEEAAEKQWNQKEVRQAVREVKARKGTGPSPASISGAGIPAEPDVLKDIAPGPLDTFQIIRLEDNLKIDLGFGIYRDLPEENTQNLKEGDIVQLTSSKTKEGFTLSVVRCPLSDLYTYRAKVTQVVDGDTFHALIDLGFGTTMAQRVRLRRIDAPEIESKEGKDAKAALEKILARDQGRVILQSRELDQHGRPIADVWVEGKSIDQELLDQGLAVKMED